MKVRGGQLNSCIDYYRRTHDLPYTYEILKILLQSKKLQLSDSINIGIVRFLYLGRSRIMRSLARYS